MSQRVTNTGEVNLDCRHARVLSCMHRVPSRHNCQLHFRTSAIATKSLRPPGPSRRTTNPLRKAKPVVSGEGGAGLVELDIELHVEQLLREVEAAAKGPAAKGKDASARLDEQVEQRARECRVKSHCAAEPDAPSVERRRRSVRRAAQPCFDLKLEPHRRLEAHSARRRHQRAPPHWPPLAGRGQRASKGAPQQPPYAAGHDG
mmetsp:Transcript_14808/g.29993  ORF Transcript_14808/g.29993 Transcript_14808/m.29993 type:complete len:203 (-) Transcript_14808:72-680(-)